MKDALGTARITRNTFTVPIKVETSYADLKEIIMTDVYKQEEIHEETIAQRDARLKKANEVEQRNERVGLMSKLDPTTGEVALCGDVAGHEFHGNQYAGGGGFKTGQEKRAEGAHTNQEHQEAIVYHRQAAREQNAVGNKEAASKHLDAADAHQDVVAGRAEGSKARKASEAAHESMGSGKAHDSPERAKAEAARSGAEHSDARDYHIREAQKAAGRGDEKIAAAHDKAADLHHVAEKTGDKEDSTKAQQASEAAHESMGSGKAHDSPERAKAEVLDRQMRNHETVTNASPGHSQAELSNGVAQAASAAAHSGQGKHEAAAAAHEWAEKNHRDAAEQSSKEAAQHYRSGDFEKGNAKSKEADQHRQAATEHELAASHHALHAGDIEKGAMATGYYKARDLSNFGKSHSDEMRRNRTMENITGLKEAKPPKGWNPDPVYKK